MKYKNISSLTHNFAHSFFSFENHSVAGFVSDLLEPLAKQGALVLHFLPTVRVESLALERDLQAGLVYAQAVMASMHHYQQWFQGLAESHGVSPAAVRSLSVKVRPRGEAGLVITAVAIDDRGSEHRAEI